MWPKKINQPCPKLENIEARTLAKGIQMDKPFNESTVSLDAWSSLGTDLSYLDSLLSQYLVVVALMRDKPLSDRVPCKDS